MSNLSTELKSSLPELAKPKKRSTALTTKLEEPGSLHNAMLAYTIQAYYSKGEFPTAERMALDLASTTKDVKAIWESEKFQSALEKQGIILRDEKNTQLSISQLLIANELLSSTNKQTVRQKLEVLKVTQAQFDGWLRDPVFQAYLRDKSEKMLENSDWAAYRGLIKAIEAGDLKAILVHLEMRGIYTPRLTVDFNVEAMITKVVDIIAKYVKDDETILTIAKEVGQLNAK